MDEILIECSPGISGDMLLAAFYDLGVPRNIFEKPLIKLGLGSSFSLSFNESRNFSFRGMKAEINVFKDNNKKHWKEIKKLILSGDLDKNLELMILNVYESLAVAEAKVHGVDPDDIHFHEIGSIDSMVDVIGVCAAINYLKPKRIYCNTPNLGKGFANTEHGKIPIPSPAVLELISKSNIEVCSNSSVEEELSTPTGISLLLSLVNCFKLPNQYSISSYGIGLGHKELPFPNFLRILKIKSNQINEVNIKNQFGDLILEEITIQEAWIDDNTPEEVASFVQLMRDKGVLDISYEAINMKKSRIGFSIKALVAVEEEIYFRNLWFQFSNTIGLRERRQTRWILPRREGECFTSLGKVKFKEIIKPNGEIFLKPEHDEIVKLQNKYNKSANEIKRIIYKSMKNFKPFKTNE